MTRTISLTIGFVITALALCVPTAFAEGRLAGSLEPDAVAYFRANELSTLSQQSRQAQQARSEALNRMYGLGEFAVAPWATYKDAHERVVEPQTVNGYIDAHERATPPQPAGPVSQRSVALNQRYGLGEFATGSTYLDAHERANPPTSAPSRVVTTTTSADDVQWPQIGLGLGIGIALAFGLMLALRATRQRPLAH